MSWGDVFSVVFYIGVTIFQMVMWFKIGRDSVKKDIEKQVSYAVTKEMMTSIIQYDKLANIVLAQQKIIEKFTKKIEPIIEEFSPVMNLKK